MGKTIEFYDQGMYAIRKEIVQCEFNCKQIDKQIDLHQSKMIEEEATGKKGKLYDWGVKIHTRIAKTSGIDKYIDRKVIIKRLAQNEAQMKRELKRFNWVSANYFRVISPPNPDECIYAIQILSLVT